jgi:hypothetical protein
MNAFDKYGLDIMGISDIESANTLLIKLTVSIFGEQSETAFRVLHGCLDELYTKADVLCTRCYGSFRIFTTLMGELTDKRNILFKALCIEFLPLTHFSCVMNGDVLEYKSNCCNT